MPAPRILGSFNTHLGSDSSISSLEVPAPPQRTQPTLAPLYQSVRQFSRSNIPLFLAPPTSTTPTPSATAPSLKPFPTQSQYASMSSSTNIVSPTVSSPMSVSITDQHQQRLLQEKQDAFFLQNRELESVLPRVSSFDDKPVQIIQQSRASTAVRTALPHATMSMSQDGESQSQPESGPKVISINDVPRDFQG